MAQVVVFGSGARANEVVRALASIGHHVTLAESELALPANSGIEVVLRVAEPLPAGPGPGSDSTPAHVPSNGRPHSMAGAPPVGAATLAGRRQRRQSYRAGENILLQVGWTGEITEGCVVLSVLHEDGQVVIIGFLGPGDFLLSHPPDSCHLLPVAVTDVQIEVSPWADGVNDKALAVSLSARVLRAEAWAAAQAHPHIEQRVFGTLSLLAEQFGTLENGERRVGVRITHSQLAAMTGATRPTITRVLAGLKRKGLVRSVGSGSKQMLQLFAGGPAALAGSVVGLLATGLRMVLDGIPVTDLPV